MIRYDRLARLGPLTVSAIALWLTGARVSPIASDAGERLAVLPSTAILVTCLVAAIVLALVTRWAPTRLSPLYLSLLIWLPFVPAPIPAALLVWHGPLAWVVWAVIASLLLLPVAGAWWARVLRWPDRRQLLLVMITTVVVYAAAAWRMAPVLPGGDEPHYLVITQSLLHDGDLRIENNHRRGDYRAYFPQDLRPDYLRRGIDREIYSIHAPGVSLLVLPAFAIAGYRGAIVFLAVVAALGAVLVWRATWRITGSPGAAWFGWAAVALTTPFLMQAFTVYPDGPGAVATMTGVYALVFPQSLAGRRWRILAHGAALAALPWLHTRYVVLACVLGALVAVKLWQAARTPAGDADARGRALGDCLVFLLVPLVSAATWFGFFHTIYGTFDPRAPYGTYTQTSLGNAPRGLAGLLVDQQFGIVPNAPVYLVGFLGMGALWRIRRRLAFEVALVVVPYAVAVACYHMWWGGHSAPARFAVPALLPFGLSTAALWSRSTGHARAACAMLLASSIGVAAVLVWADRGGLVYNVRDGFALWMDRAAPLVNLPRAVPTMFRNSRGITAALVGGWVLAAALAWMLLRAFAPAGSDARRATAAWFAGAAALTAGVALGWRIAGAAPLESGTGLLRVARAAAERGSLVKLPSLAREPTAHGLRQIRLPSALRRDRADDGMIFAAWDLPAGEYRLIADGHPALAGALEATVGRRVAPYARVMLDGTPAGETAMRLDLPAGARVLTISGDEVARRRISAVSLRIERLSAGTDLEFARRAVRYGATLVWFVDDGAFAEAEGWWVRGRASAVFVVEAASRSPSQPLLVRNGGLPNRVVLASGSWSAALDLEPGEERSIELPLANGRARLAVTSREGFRPSEVDRSSRDTRLLGVWIQP